HLLVALSFYLVWVLFIISFTTMMSTIFKSQGFIALMAIVILLGSRLFTNLDLALNIFNPASMSDAAAKVLITGTIDLKMGLNLVMSLILVALIGCFTYYWISHKKYDAI